MSQNSRLFLLACAYFCMLLCMSEANHILSAYALYLDLTVIFILFQGLYLPSLSGFIITLITGFLISASKPAPGSSYVLFILILWLGASWARKRIRRENTNHVRIVAISLQLLWFFLLTLEYGFPQLVSIDAGIRFATDATLSLLFISLFAPFTCSLLHAFFLETGGHLPSE